MDDAKLLKELLEEQCDIKGYSAEKLAAATGIPDRFVKALLEDAGEKLPAAPYIRGYLKKIGQALDLDGDELWLAYQRESEPRRSGKNDLLPKNRFALQRISKPWAAAGIVGVLVVLYAAVNAGRLLGTPGLTVETPREGVSTTVLGAAVIEGVLENPADRLSVNGEQIVVDERGKFRREYPLDPGTNAFTITAKRFLGKETAVTRQIIYEPPAAKTEVKIEENEQLLQKGPQNEM